MNKKTLLFSVIAATMLFASCADAPEADKAETTEAQEVKTKSGNTHYADLGLSKVEWIGTKPVGQHHGTFEISEGSLSVQSGTIQGGSFVIDIASISPDDQNDEYNGKLEGHLKSADFFDTEKYPTARFEITNVTDGVIASEDLIMKDATHTVTGNLTMKDVTKSITFPAKVNIAEGTVTADANFNIDRTNWGLVYGNDESLGDKFIRPTVNVQLHLVANEQM